MSKPKHHHHRKFFVEIGGKLVCVRCERYVREKPESQDG